MNDYVILTDSSSDMPAELREQYGIGDYVRGVLYCPDGRELRSDTDWKHGFTPESFYGAMKGRKALFKTATPVYGEVEELFERYLKAGKDVLCVTMSSGISGTFRICQEVGQALCARYPERKLRCVDSLRYCGAEALLVMLASQNRAEGMSLEENAANLEEARFTLRQSGTMDDLFFLAKVGRIGSFKALFGSLAGVTPVAEISRAGMSEVLAKFKGRRTAFDATLRYMARTIVAPEKQTILIGQSVRAEAAEQLAALVRKEFAPKELKILPIGTACGASIGPGMCAVFYRGTPVSEELAEERKLMGEISEALKKK